MWGVIFFCFLLYVIIFNFLILIFKSTQLNSRRLCVKTPTDHQSAPAQSVLCSICYLLNSPQTGKVLEVLVLSSFQYHGKDCRGHTWKEWQYVLFSYIEICDKNLFLSHINIISYCNIIHHLTIYFNKLLFLKFTYKIIQISYQKWDNIAVT